MAQEAGGSEAPADGQQYREKDERSEYGPDVHAKHRQMRATRSLGPNGPPLWAF